MIVGIGVFKKKICIFVIIYVYCFMRKKEVRLYSFSVYNINYIYICNLLCMKIIISYKKNKFIFIYFVEIFYKIVVS